MKNTSSGVHTFAFFQRMREEEYFDLRSHFNEFKVKTNELNDRPLKDKNGRITGWEYTYKKRKGIRWLLLTTNADSKFTIYGIMVIITPKVLIENNYIAVMQFADLNVVEDMFNREAERISPLIRKFGSCSMNRSDPGLTLDLKELGIPCSPEQMIKLIKRGDIPKHFKERKVYDDNDKSHRKKADKHSFYLESNSVVINYYWKYPKQTIKHPNYANRENSRNVIRLEVQCKYPKLYSIAKTSKDNSKYVKYADGMPDEVIWNMINYGIKNPSIPLDVILSDDISDDVIRSYYNKIIRQGDYFTLEGARWMVKAHYFRQEKEERLLFALEYINECRGIANAKAKLFGDDLHDFKRSLRDLDDIFVNPVTIPREWGINHIQNPLKAYYLSTIEVPILFCNEVLFERLLAEYLA